MMYTGALARAQADLLSNQPATLVIFDAHLTALEQLQSGLEPGAVGVTLSGDRDGIVQITEILQNHRGITSLHIVSHGAPNCLYLGNGQLDLRSLDHYTPLLLQWQQALHPDAEILLYGCDVAADPAQPLALIHQLKQLTGAEVAAATQPVGDSQQGGTWELAARTGSMAGAIALSPETQAAYSGVFGVSIYDPIVNPDPFASGFLTYNQIPLTPGFPITPSADGVKGI